MMTVYLHRLIFMLKTLLKRYFLTGLLVIIPIWGTVLILKAIFVGVEGILGDLLVRLVPSHYVPGLGILTLVVLVFAAGLFATNFMGRQIVKWWEDLLNRVPLVRGIYSTLKSMMDILSFSKHASYNRVVMIQFPKKRPLLYRLRDGRDQRGDARPRAGAADSCVCADVTESDVGLFPAGAGA
jgi:uncharacterized membrane protein